MERMHRREGSNEGIIMKVWDCGSPLYDSYELASLGHVIDRHVLALPFLSGSSRPVKQISHSSAVFPIAEEEIESEKAKKGCSMVSCVGDLLEKFLWKRRQKEEKPMKVMMNSGVCNNIWNRVGPRALEYKKSFPENVQEI